MNTVRDGDLDVLTVPDAEFKLVAPCLHVALFTDTDFSQISQQALAIYERYLALCPPGRLRWYSTENMTRHKVATPRSFDMLRGWLKLGAPARKELHIQLKEGADDIDTPSWAFEIDGVAPGGYAHGRRTNMIACSFAPDSSADAIAAFCVFATEMFEQCPFRWGYAGYALHMSPYKESDSQQAAWRLSMQYPGVDIVTTSDEYLRVGRGGIKNINWMTMLGPEFVQKLGGETALREQLPPGIYVGPVGQGLVVRTGDAPELGHVNRQDYLPAYRAVYKTLEPLQRPIVQGFTAFALPGNDYKEKTTAWLRRFSDENHV
jgi:hypothetical protein